MADVGLMLAAAGERLPWLAPMVGGLLGAVAGSFLGCARYRLPRGLSLWSPPSSCMACGHVLAAPDLIPIFSWLALKGRCRKCRAPFGPETLVLEILSALVGAALGGLIGFSLWFFPLMLGGLAAYGALVLIF